MNKIKMQNPIVEMDGDEMTRIIWQMIKDKLLSPYIDLNTEYYDLSMVYRDQTNDQVTTDSALATKKHKVAVKCATITANAQRVEEFGLKQMWKSPNATIRGILDGTVFRTPIIVKGIEPYVKNWTKPITIARHAYGDIYKSAELAVDAGSKAEILVTDKDGNETKVLIHNYDTAGIVQGVHNIDESIESFAKGCFEYALEINQDMYFSAKDTISKIYDHRFKDIFNDMYANEYKDKFEKADIKYYYTLIDDAVARSVRTDGGFIWACKNYDGDVMSDLIASSFGSLGMMTSVLVAPDGAYEYEAAHGTVTSHYRRHMRGDETSTNSIATIFAWTGAIRKRGELDNNADLVRFADCLDKACIKTIESGVMTRDLAALSTLETIKSVNTETFLDEIKSNLDQLYNNN